jgi:transcriptional regulator with XRE-family HTH domain
MSESRSVVMDRQKVKAWMDKERWNKSSLARRLDLSPATVGRYLNGKLDAPYTFIVALAAIAGMKEADFTRDQAA